MRRETLDTEMVHSACHAGFLGHNTLIQNNMKNIPNIPDRVPGVQNEYSPGLSREVCTVVAGASA